MPRVPIDSMPFDLQEAKRSQYYPMLFSMAAVAVSMVLAFLIFRDGASMPMVFLAAIAIAPMVMEKLRKEKVDVSKKHVVFKHGQLVTFYAYTFFGLAAGFAIFYTILPDQMAASLYDSQLNAVARPAFTFQTSLFLEILANNLGLLFGFFLLSVLYGYGSLLLLTWNASILGVVWGNAFRSLPISGSHLVIKNVVFIWPYLLPEVVAYFLGAIAGGLVYLSLRKPHHTLKQDYIYLMASAVLLLVIGAAIETVVLGLA